MCTEGGNGMTYPHPESVGNKNRPGGYAGLDSTGHLTSAVLGVSEVAHSTTSTLTSTDLGRMHACTVASPYTVTLPTPVGFAGQTISVRVVPSSVALLTLATAAGNINGTSTRILWAGESAVLESDGTNWVKVGGRSLPMVAAIGANATTAIPTSATTFVTLDTSQRDNTGLMVNTGGSGLIFRRPGTYTVRGRIGMVNAPANASRVLAQVYKSATPVVQGEVSALSGGNTTFSITDEVVFALSDAINLAMFQNSGSSWSGQTGAGQNASSLSATEVITW
jgi:hypothetical protein